MNLRLGLGLITSQQYPGDSRTDRERYEEALELAALADELGLDSVFVSEHYFVDDGYLPSLLPMCAAIAARTERILVGTALLLAPLHDPLRVAEDAAVVDFIAGGRPVVGLGLGWRAEELDAFGVRSRDRVARLERAVTVPRQAWGPGRVTAARPAGNGSGVAVNPKPWFPGGPPVWIGATNKPAVRRAGRIADRFMATEVTPDGLAEQVAWAREARGEPSSRHQFEVSVHLPTFPWSDGDAFEVAADYLRYVGWEYDDMDGARARTGLPLASPPWAAGERDTLRAGSLVGTPDEVAARIGGYCRAAGGDLRYIARLLLPGLAPQRQRLALRLFAAEVAPRARELAGEAA